LRCGPDIHPDGLSPRLTYIFLILGKTHQKPLFFRRSWKFDGIFPDFQGYHVTLFSIQELGGGVIPACADGEKYFMGDTYPNAVGIDNNPRYLLTAGTGVSS
jgi:hypothetical protein